MASFIDEAQVHVHGGDGGAGAVSFRREAHVAKGGPDGGDGGGGGDVVLVSSHDVSSLLAFRDQPHRRAPSGAHGRGGGRRHGRRGADLVVSVPIGTVVRAPGGDLLADLDAEGAQVIAAQGGRGGRGNARFLSNRMRAPAFAEQAEPGEEHWLDLELKLIADVALVGFPNAGKSTLISRLSAARPRIADYPFTTLEPHLGVVHVGPRGSASAGSTEFILADIPGLIEGASEGRGLGHRFLRHVERARVLAVLADLSPDAERPPAEQVEVLLSELGQYRRELLNRPRLIIGSRADLATETAPAPYGGELEVSAVTGAGLDELARRLAGLVAAGSAGPVGRPAGPVIHRPEPEGISIVRRAGEFVVVGAAAARAVALSDLTDPGAQSHLERQLRRLGVGKALRRAGAHTGDIVHVGEHSFSYVEDP